MVEKNKQMKFFQGKSMGESYSRNPHQRFIYCVSIFVPKKHSTLIALIIFLDWLSSAM